MNMGSSETGAELFLDLGWELIRKLRMLTEMASHNTGQLNQSVVSTLELSSAENLIAEAEFKMITIEKRVKRTAGERGVSSEP